MEAQVLKIVAQDLLVNDDALLHVSVVEGVKGVESAFSDHVVEKDETCKYGACVNKADASNVAHTLNIPNVWAVHGKSF